MRRFLVGFAILAIAAPSPRLAWAGDQQIAKQIVQSLESEKSKGNLRHFNIELRVKKGAVYLSGHVANAKQEKLALAAARKATGVQQIFNEIEVAPRDSRSAPKIKPVSTGSLAPSIGSAARAAATTKKKATREPTANKETNKKIENNKKAEIQTLQNQPKRIFSRLTKSEKSVLGRKPVETASLTARQMQRTSIVSASITNDDSIADAKRDDSMADAKRIATEIIDKLRQEKESGNLRKFGIEVEVDHGVVWLKGSVSSASQQKRVLDIARRVSGVKQVGNDLAINEATTVPVSLRLDDTIAQEVVQLLERYKQHGHLQRFGIDVHVENASVWLTGYVADDAQRDLVLEAARHVSGVEEVVNDLTLFGPDLAAGSAQAHQPVQYTQGGRQTPLAFAPAHPANHQATVPGTSPVPMRGSAGMGVAPARYDHPQMPGYAWPSYAAHPNYGAVTYPNQYSASAWPYIGPFYPYPQVPLGWRKVTLEWDDGWWQLDFKDRNRR
jgi:osmotically-inducible protein OsmY